MMSYHCPRAVGMVTACCKNRWLSIIAMDGRMLLGLVVECCRSRQSFVGRACACLSGHWCWVKGTGNSDHYCRSLRLLQEVNPSIWRIGHQCVSRKAVVLRAPTTSEGGLTGCVWGVVCLTTDDRSDLMPLRR